MSLEKIILDELQKLDLGGAGVSDVSLYSSSVYVTIEIGKASVNFKVDDHDQYQVLSVVYEGMKYDHPDDLAPYHDWVTQVIGHIMPVVTHQLSEYEVHSERIEQRENEARKREDQLNKRAYELAAREQLLDFQEQALEFENHIFDEEQARAQAQKFRTWVSENDHLIKWPGLAVMMAVVLIFTVSRIGEYLGDRGVIARETQVQGLSDVEDVENIKENFEPLRDATTDGQDHAHTPVTLSPGEFVVGDAITPGRYTITPIGFGHLVVNRGDEQVINEIIGSDGQGVPSITISLSRDDIVEVIGEAYVALTPVISQLRTTLTTGIWTVGVDIEAGTFHVTTENSTGNLIIRSSLGRLRTNAIIGDREVDTTTSPVVLEEGDVIAIINGLTHINFE